MKTGTGLTLILLTAMGAMAAPPPSSAAPDVSGPARQDMLRRLGKIAFVARSEFGMHGTNATMLAHGTLRGSAICVYDPATPDAAPKTIYETKDGFIFDMNPSYDGTKLVFAHKTKFDEPFHLWEINVNGTGLRQLTNQRYHDVSPAYLPDGRIVFVSTRVEAYSMCQNFLAAALYVCDANGSDIRRLEYNTLSNTSPSVQSDGTILFGRWEYQDKNIFCTQALWTINPNGTRVQMFYGNTLTVPNSMYGARQIPGTDKVVFTMAAHHHIPVGAIGVINRTAGLENVNDLANITPEVPYVPATGRTWQETNWHPGDAFFGWAYADPWPVDDQIMLVSYAGPNREPPFRHRLYAMDYQGNKTLVYAGGKTGCYSAVSLNPRPLPQIVSGNPPSDPNGEGTFIVQDIYQGLREKGVTPGQITHLRVCSQVPKKWNTEGPRYADHYPVAGQGTYYIKQVYGTVPVTPEGTACFKAPAGVELYFQALDKNGKEIRRMGTLTQITRGETQNCIGCHESRTTAPAASAQAARNRLAQRPDEITPPSWGAGTVNYVAMVQPVLDRYCVKCHSGPTPPAKVNLSGDKTRLFNMSYETLTRTHRSVEYYWLNTGPTGNFPPLASGSWVSRLTQLIESRHSDVSMDAESRRRIYTWIDMNVPYYGTWDMCRPHSLGGRDAWTIPSEKGAPELAPWVARLDDYLERNCDSCHARNEDWPRLSNKRAPLKRGEWNVDNTWINLTRPQNSFLLTAHLANSAGGWELNGAKKGIKSPVLFKSTSDPLYLQLLDILQAAKKNLETYPRIDMPGAKVIPQIRDFGRTF